MIHLTRNETPLILTPSFVLSETIRYKTTDANVWNIDDIKESLHRLSNNKCAYCECNVNEESKYMEVEHFEDKHNNPDKVLDWNNLLPACKKCNGAKHTHDVIAEPIVNPFEMDPRDHLKLSNYRFKHKSPIGKTTITIVRLNDYDRAVTARFNIGEEIHKNIDLAEERLDNYVNKRSIYWRNKLHAIVHDTLKECQPDSMYSATCATVLHTDDTYNYIRNEMTVLGLWTSELETLHQLSYSLKMDV